MRIYFEECVHLLTMGAPILELKSHPLQILAPGKTVLYYAEQPGPAW